MSNAPTYVLVRAPAHLVWELWAHPQFWDAWHPNVRQVRMLQEGDCDTGFLRDSLRWLPFRIAWMREGLSFGIETRPLPDLRLIVSSTLVQIEKGCIAAQSVHLEGPMREAFEAPMVEFARRDIRQSLEYLRDLAEFLNEVTSTGS